MAPHAPTGNTTIELPSLGSVKGLIFEDGTSQFCGIPYGNLSKRWSRAELKTTLDGGYHDGTQHGPIFPQPPEFTVGEDYMVPVKPFPHFSASIESEFDALRLNVVVPPSSRGKEHLLPVMVWIHGGAFIFGSSTHPVFDLVNLVSYSNQRGTPVIGVSINYRVGLFGFLASTAIKDDLANDGYSGVGNFGLTDQQTALEWIQTHVRAFGGNPDNVTIFGESAGGVSVANQVAAAKPPVFHRAISMSGTLQACPTWSLEQHEKRWNALLQYFGIDAHAKNALDRLRELPQEAIARATCPIEGAGFEFANPCDDGWFYASSPSLTQVTPAPSWLKGYMIGNVKHEGMIFTPALSIHTYNSTKDMMSKVLSSSEIELVFSIYGIHAGSSAEELQLQLSQMAADASFGWPDRAYIQNCKMDKVFAYHFDQLSTLDNPYKGLAYHAIDLLYVFMNLMEGMTDGQQQLARKVAGDFLDFAWGKDPWEAYSANGRWMIYGPDDKHSIITESEDEEIRKYSRMDRIRKAGLYEAWTHALHHLVCMRWAV